MYSGRGWMLAEGASPSYMKTKNHPTAPRTIKKNANPIKKTIFLRSKVPPKTSRSLSGLPPSIQFKGKILFPSFRRKPESSLFIALQKAWTPFFNGVTTADQTIKERML
jgi:hypothetical protein